MELGIPEERLEVIYNSLNSGVEGDSQLCYKNAQLSEHFKNDYPTLLFVGRLTKVKKLDWIINAHSHHKAKGINYNLLIIGDGTERQSLEELAYREDTNNNVWFYGECYNDDELSTLIYNSELCISPGNVGLTALHAMSYGTPVISNDDFETQMPEYETIIPGKTGDLYKYGSFDDFCSKIENWLSSNHNREDVRKSCYAVINGKFNSEYQINLLKKVIS